MIEEYAFYSLVIFFLSVFLLTTVMLALKKWSMKKAGKVYVISIMLFLIIFYLMLGLPFYVTVGFSLFILISLIMAYKDLNDKFGNKDK